ncbi:MAG TPA: MFS transporter [Defluviitoga sp.]|nr:MFS transporter [Defluviitaleaceae bacterium]HPZ74900.1 MFS transporter [Candidatus Pacearchaeota archaeon]HQD63498.1 MFS transporter [Defluviitoga sp.]
MRYKNEKLQKWVTLLIVAFTGGVIDKICYLRETYYVPLQKVTGASNFQLGILMSAYGVTNFLLYIPGGILADNYSPKKLIVFSCFATSILGFWYSLIPSFGQLIFIHVMFGFTVVLTFWAAMVKIINNLGDSSEQGKLFGISEGLRGMFGAIAAFVSIIFFNKMASEAKGLKAAITCYSVILILGGVLAVLFIVEPKTSNSFEVNEVKNEEKKELKEKKGSFLVVVKMPQIWLAGILVFANYSAWIFHSMVTPYLSQAFELSTSAVATLSTIRTYVMMMIGGLVAGLLTSKIGSVVRFIQYGFFGMIIFGLGYLLIPPNRSCILLIVLNFILYGLCLYSTKALYYATIDEIFVPKELVGRASGIISLVGYCPEIFMYMWAGNIVDNAEGLSGYRRVFMLMIIFAAIGLIVSIILKRYIEKERQHILIQNSELKE